MTGCKSAIGEHHGKAQTATCGAVQADTPLRYVIAFKLSIGERNEKKQGAGQRHMKNAGSDTSLRYVTGPETT